MSVLKGSGDVMMDSVWILFHDVMDVFSVVINLMKLVVITTQHHVRVFIIDTHGLKPFY
jgi:hypothetical protein